MVKLIKIKDLIFQNIEERTIDENGNEIWNIPSDLEELRNAVIDTINWVIGDKIKKALGDFTKLSAANSKGIVLLTKLINSLNPDTSNLTGKEQSAWNKMLQLAENNYADSDLLNASLDNVLNQVQQGQNLTSQALNATNIDELINILNSL